MSPDRQPIPPREARDVVVNINLVGRHKQKTRSDRVIWRVMLNCSVFGATSGLGDGNASQPSSAGLPWTLEFLLAVPKNRANGW
jgi:hypothetical protein